MIFNEKAYDEVFPRVPLSKPIIKRETMLPDPEDEIEEEDGIEVETPEAPETDPEEGQANDESGTGDPVS